MNLIVPFPNRIINFDTQDQFPSFAQIPQLPWTGYVPLCSPRAPDDVDVFDITVNEYTLGVLGWSLVNVQSDTLNIYSVSSAGSFVAGGLGMPGDYSSFLCQIDTGSGLFEATAKIYTMDLGYTFETFLSWPQFRVCGSSGIFTFDFTSWPETVESAFAESLDTELFVNVVSSSGNLVNVLVSGTGTPDYDSIFGVTITTNVRGPVSFWTRVFNQMWPSAF